MFTCVKVADISENKTQKKRRLTAQQRIQDSIVASSQYDQANNKISLTRFISCAYTVYFREILSHM